MRLVGRFCVYLSVTREKLASRKAKAVRFLRDVKHDARRAAEVERESLEHYAQRRHIKLKNPFREAVILMASESKAELKRRIKELEAENEDLQTKLDDIYDLAAPADEEEDESEEDGAGEGDEEEVAEDEEEYEE